MLAERIEDTGDGGDPDESVGEGSSVAPLCICWGDEEIWAGAVTVSGARGACLVDGPTGLFAVLHLIRGWGATVPCKLWTECIDGGLEGCFVSCRRITVVVAPFSTLEPLPFVAGYSFCALSVRLACSDDRSVSVR